MSIARVSSSREDKTAEPERLISYLIRNSHWSPFEHAFATMEIETSKAIAIQLLRHRSFTFQELSQRYANVGEMFDSGIFEPIELRRQAISNRQSSEEVFDPVVEVEGSRKADYAFNLIGDFLRYTEHFYIALLEADVAKECARMILPMATKTTIYMTGPIRSWLHFIQIRDDAHAQKEIQLVAREIKAILAQHVPDVITAFEKTLNK